MTYKAHKNFLVRSLSDFISEPVNKCRRLGWGICVGGLQPGLRMECVFALSRINLFLLYIGLDLERISVICIWANALNLTDFEEVQKLSIISDTIQFVILLAECRFLDLHVGNRWKDLFYKFTFWILRSKLVLYFVILNIKFAYF